MKVQKTVSILLQEKIKAHQNTILFLSIEIQELQKRAEKLEKLNLVPYEKLSCHMSVRLDNCLFNANLHSTERLLDFIYSKPQPHSLLCIKNFGRKHKNELQDILLEVLGIDIEDVFNV